MIKYNLYKYKKGEEKLKVGGKGEIDKLSGYALLQSIHTGFGFWLLA